MSLKLDMTFLNGLLVIVISGTVVSSTDYNPCKDFEEFNFKRVLEDPSDCSKYYECRVHRGHSNSFVLSFRNIFWSQWRRKLQRSGFRNPDPSVIPDCYQGKQGSGNRFLKKRSNFFWNRSSTGLVWMVRMVRMFNHLWLRNSIENKNLSWSKWMHRIQHGN